MSYGESFIWIRGQVGDIGDCRRVVRIRIAIDKVYILIDKRVNDDL